MNPAKFLLVLGLALVACRSKKPEPAPPAEKPVASAPAASAPAAAPEPEPEPPELPTESDYEEEATERITGSNLERELDKLEKELLGR